MLGARVPGYVLAESMRPDARLDGLPLTLRRIERYTVGNATPNQPAVWTTVVFDFAEEASAQVADALAGVLDERAARTPTSTSARRS